MNTSYQLLDSCGCPVCDHTVNTDRDGNAVCDYCGFFIGREELAQIQKEWEDFVAMKDKSCPNCGFDLLFTLGRGVHCALDCRR